MVSIIENRTRRFVIAGNIRAAGLLITILASSVVFHLWSTPAAGLGPYSLVITPDVTKSIAQLLAHDPLKLLLPYQYEPGRWYWSATLGVIFYGLYKLFSPTGVYIFLSGLLIVTSFVASWVTLRSYVLSGTIAFALGLGTQFAYGLTMGSTFALYLLLSYVCVNLAIGMRLLRSPLPRPHLIAGFAASLVFVALSTEWWLNYATSLLAAAAFLSLWQRRHGVPRRGAPIVLLTTLIVLVLYLVVRLRVAGQYVSPGAEEELIFGYHSWLLAAEDLIANFFTLLYMALSNYLPPFPFGSLSQTYLGDAAILAGQNGYDSPHTQLVLMGHLFLWRFYAGAMVAFFCVGGIGWVRRAWRQPVIDDVVLATLFLATIAGCGTHLIIKYRPYMSAPALTYKAVVSVFFFTLLIGYAAMIARNWFKHAASYRASVAGLWAVIAVGALTRPAMLDVMLRHVGLMGYGDPAGALMRLLH